MNARVPHSSQDVMISSTTLDLPTHRKMVEDAIFRAGMHPKAMERSSARSDSDSIKFSLEMVDEANVYVGVFGHRYGHVPEDPQRNADGRSVTELEYRHAKARCKPVLVFIMGDEHPILAKDMDDGVKLEKLRALKKDLLDQEIVARFDSPEHLRTLVLQALIDLRKEQTSGEVELEEKVESRPEPILPRPPELFSLAPYVLGTEFVGRRSELFDLDNWARSPDTIMVMEAIGGLGKSAVAWEWLKTRAYQSIPGLAGAVWWNFEKHNSVRSMVRHVLAYIRGEDPRELRGPSGELMEQLGLELRRRPFLLVLDGLERVLTAYHHLNAAQTVDEAVNVKLRDATDPGDNETLEALASCSPSKMLITTRLMPSALESRAGMPLPGVRLVELKGLRPADALSLMEELGVHGDGDAMIRLCEQFGYHSLLIGITAGLILDYRRAPGDFDKWRADPRAGGELHLASLDLTNGRSHILKFAIDSLEESKRRLLSRIAVYTESVDYMAIEALSPYLPTKLSDEPQQLTEDEQRKAIASLDAALAELEDRRLLKWDRPTNTYDLHPVVRGYAFDLLKQEEKAQTFDRVRDHFWKLPPEQMKAPSDVSELKTRIGIFRALVGAGRFDDAANLYVGEFASALLQTLNAAGVVVAMLTPLYEAMHKSPKCVSVDFSRGYIINDLAIAHSMLGDIETAKALGEEAIRVDLAADLRPTNVAIHVGNYANYLSGIRSRFLLKEWVYHIYSDLITDVEQLNRSRLDLARLYRYMVKYDEAASILDEIEPLEKPGRETYSNNEVEIERLRLKHGLQKVSLEDLDKRRAALLDDPRGGQGQFHMLYGDVALAQGQPAIAVEAFQEAIRLQRKAGLPEHAQQARLALALAKAGLTSQAQELLGSLLERGYTGYSLAEIFLAIGDSAQAESFAMSGYEAAWGDGPPYQDRENLRRMEDVLRKLGVPVPTLPLTVAAEPQDIPFAEEIKAYFERYRRKIQLESHVKATMEQSEVRGFQWVFNQLEAMREQVGAHSGEPALRQHLANSVVNAISACKTTSACDGIPLGLALLETLSSSFPDDGKIREALSSGLSIILEYHAEQGGHAEARATLARLHELAAQVPDAGKEWDDLARGYYTMAFYAGRDRRFEEIDRSLVELALLTEGTHARPAIRANRSLALRLAVNAYGEAGRLEQVGACLADLEKLASGHAAEGGLRHQLAHSLASASFNYGVARRFGEVDRCERRAIELRDRFSNEPQLRLALSGVYGNAAIRLAAARRWEDAEDRLGKARNLVGEDQADMEVAGYFGWSLSGVAHYYAREGLYEKAKWILAELEKLARDRAEDATLLAPLGAGFCNIAWHRGLAGGLEAMDAWTEQLECLSKRLERATYIDVYVLLARTARIALGVVGGTKGMSIQNLTEAAEALDCATQGKPEHLRRRALETLALREQLRQNSDGASAYLKEWRRLGGSWWETEIGFALAALASADVERAKNHLRGALIEVQDPEDLEWYSRILSYLHRDMRRTDAASQLDEMIQSKVAELAMADSSS